MIFLLALAWLNFNSIGWANDWIVIAETKKCEEKVEILAKSGEKYVLAILGGDKIKLYPQDDSAFKAKILTSQEYSSRVQNNKKFIFYYPGENENNLPKFDFIIQGERKRCNLDFLHPKS